MTTPAGTTYGASLLIQPPLARYTVTDIANPHAAPVTIARGTDVARSTNAAIRNPVTTPLRVPPATMKLGYGSSGTNQMLKVARKPTAAPTTAMSARVRMIDEPPARSVFTRSLHVARRS